jgi:FdhD protein
VKRAGPSVPAPVRRYGAPRPSAGGRSERVAGEEPLQLRVEGEGGSTALVTTLRTPGADFELAAGFLLAEGIVRERDEILGLRYCHEVDDADRYNVVHVRLAPSARLPEPDGLHRFAATAACGVCGKGQLVSLEERGCTPLADDVRVSAALLAGLPDRLRRHQPLFERTGGLHAAGLFTPDGTLLAVREDVGRHNALDKLYGWAFLGGLLPLASAIVCVSGRAGYELLQKSVVARVPVFAAVSAPSSLAVAVARGFGVTLAAFVRDGRFNVYAGAERVVDDLGA